MSLMDIYKDYNITLHDCLLKHTTNNIEDFNVDEVVTTLKQGYLSRDPNVIRVSTLINSIFTHHAQTFMLTKRLFVDLIKNDTNNNYSSINGIEYKLLLKLMMDTNHFICLRKPKGNKSGVYKAVQPDLISNLHSLHSKEWFEIQEKKVCNFYDEKDQGADLDGRNSYEIMRESLRKKGHKL